MEKEQHNIQNDRIVKKFLPSDKKITILIILFLSVLWYFAAHKIQNELVLPYFEKTMKAFVNSLTDQKILYNLGITLKRVLLGSLYALLIGVPVGLIMGASSTMRKILSPFINSIRQVPVMAWIPLSIIWFGLGEGPTLFLITLTGVFPIIINTLDGVLGIDKNLYNAAKSMGAGPIHTFMDVAIPGAIPGIFTGIRLSTGLGWMSVI